LISVKFKRFTDSAEARADWHGTVLLCGTWMDAGGLTDAELTDGVRHSTMDDLVTATAAADKMLAF
jgi:sulfur relay (sulfurtransferase) complex TusBCD TusD component (DsrE family)